MIGQVLDFVASLWVFLTCCFVFVTLCDWWLRVQVLSLLALIAAVVCACGAILIRKNNKYLFWINTFLAVANGGLAIMGFTEMFTILRTQRRQRW